MKVKVVRVFNDLKEKKTHEINEEFEVTKKRYEEILAADKKEPFVEIIEEDDKELEKEPEKEAEK